MLHGTETSPYDKTNHPLLLAGKFQSIPTTSIPEGEGGDGDVVETTTDDFRVLAPHQLPPASGGELVFPEQQSSSHTETPDSVMMYVSFYATQLTQAFFDWSFKLLSLFLAATFKLLL